MSWCICWLCSECEGPGSIPPPLRSLRFWVTRSGRDGQSRLVLISIRKLPAQFTRPNREPCNDTVVCVAPAAETTRPPRQRTKTPSTSIEIDGPQRTPRHNPKPARSFILGACDRPTSGFSCGTLPLCMTGSHTAPPLRPPMTLTLLGLAFESKHQSVEVSGSCTKRCS